MGAAFFSVPGAFAQQLVPTAAQTEGPFYPDHLPLDTDNDLLIINDAITPAVGAVTMLSGRILDASGQPVRNALVEIWQVDNNGVYIHSGSNNRKKHDTNFQGFGRFLTGSSGEYLFRTVKPVPYPGRTPHIHFAVKTKGREKFITQCYIKGEPQNETDQVLRALEGRQGKGDADGAVHADADVEDRRAGGKVRHRAGIHADRVMLVNHRDTSTTETQRHKDAQSLCWRNMKLLARYSAYACAVAVMAAVSPAWAQAPAANPFTAIVRTSWDGIKKNVAGSAAAMPEARLRIQACANGADLRTDPRPSGQRALLDVQRGQGREEPAGERLTTRRRPRRPSSSRRSRPRSPIATRCMPR